jgi:hypothetical protein
MYPRLTHRHSSHSAYPLNAPPQSILQSLVALSTADTTNCQSCLINDFRCQWKDPDPGLTVDSLPLHTTFPRYRTEQSFTSLTRYVLGRYPDETLPIAVIVADDKPEFLIETSLLYNVVD